MIIACMRTYFSGAFLSEDSRRLWTPHASMLPFLKEPEVGRYSYVRGALPTTAKLCYAVRAH